MKVTVTVFRDLAKLVEPAKLETFLKNRAYIEPTLGNMLRQTQDNLTLSQDVMPCPELIKCLERQIVLLAGMIV